MQCVKGCDHEMACTFDNEDLKALYPPPYCIDCNIFRKRPCFLQNAPTI